jgi:hypothetical protein
VSNRIVRTTGSPQGLAWTAAACITVSLLVMIAVSFAGPSVVVPAMAHAPDGAPPWWVSLGPSRPLALFTMWGAAAVAAIGVGVGLLAVSRGARFPVRPLLATSFIAIAVLVFLPPAGTTDTQSYAIDGNMVTLKHSPYVFTPAAMADLGDKLAVGSPPTWQNELSDYGPIATTEEWTAAELGGHSMALITFWLKLFVALAFGAVTLLLDRLLRRSPAMRLRAHLLWSVNPLLLWEIVASGHIDGLAIAFGIAGLAVLRFTSDGVRPTLARCTAAGILLAAAACTKSPLALFLVAALWTLRRSPARIACLLGGWLGLTVSSYAITGLAAVKVLFQRGQQVTWDNLYQLVYHQLTPSSVPGWVFPVAVAAFIGVGAIAFFRLPDRVPGLPAVTPALALSLAWIFFWPFQRPWYDVMIIALLALYPSSRLDLVVLIRLCFGAVTYMEAASVPASVGFQHVQLIEGHWVTAIVRLLAAAALIWMALTGRWGSRPDQPRQDLVPTMGPEVADPPSVPRQTRGVSGTAAATGSR